MRPDIEKPSYEDLIQQNMRFLEGLKISMEALELCRKVTSIADDALKMLIEIIEEEKQRKK